MLLFVKALWSEAIFLWHDALAWWRAHWRWFTPVMLVLLAAIWIVVHPNDHAWLKTVRNTPRIAQHPDWKQAAGTISDWGDFDLGNLIVFVLMLMVAKWLRSAQAQRLAVAVLMSGALAGLIAVLIRGTIGRARPSADVADGLYGLTFQTQLQSCPSGHTATSFGLAIACMVGAPRVGWLALPFAIAVAWSRMYLNRHYPADILTGVCVALCIGIPFGMAARRAALTVSSEKVNRNTCT
jgi:undecaprenyl-diphosphatase